MTEDDLRFRLQIGLFVDESIYPQWYGETHGGDHKMYIAEILNCWVR